MPPFFPSRFHCFCHIFPLIEPIFKLSFVLTFRQEEYWSGQFKSETESNRLNKILIVILKPPNKYDYRLSQVFRPMLRSTLLPFCRELPAWTIMASAGTRFPLHFLTRGLHRVLPVSPWSILEYKCLAPILNKCVGRFFKESNQQKPGWGWENRTPTDGVKVRCTNLLY